MFLSFCGTEFLKNLNTANMIKDILSFQKKCIITGFSVPNKISKIGRFCCRLIQPLQYSCKMIL